MGDDDDIDNDDDDDNDDNYDDVDDDGGDDDGDDDDDDDDGDDDADIEVLMLGAQQLFLEYAAPLPWMNHHPIHYKLQYKLQYKRHSRTCTVSTGQCAFFHQTLRQSEDFQGVRFQTKTL